MDKKQFAIFVAALKTYYPREERLLPNNQAMLLWFGQLQDIPYEVAETALNKWVANNKWSPSIAELRAIAAEIQRGGVPEWSTSWERAIGAVRHYGNYRAGEAVDSMDELTREAVKRIGGYLYLCSSENIVADRANFRTVYEQLAERKRKEAQMPEALLAKIEAMKHESKRLEVNNG